MLHELRVENLLLLERAELRLAPGLNVLTGETGAGKTLLAQALDLLLGGKARAGVVRGGAAEAYVEGVFALPEGLPRPEILPDGAEELALARRVWPDGRTRAYVCGRSATAADLRELGGQVLAFYGQHEHRKLMLSAAQLDLVDAHCGAGQARLRENMAAAHAQTRHAQARLDEVQELAGARDRELDLLAFELGEIEAAAPDPEETDALVSERDRLRHLRTLREAALSAVAAVAPDGDGGATDLLAQGAGQLAGAGTIDSALAPLASRLEAVRYEAEELGRELRGYLAELEAQEGAEGEGSGRLEAVEERLALLARLERKHGGTMADVLAYAERCRVRIQELDQAEVALEVAERELADARDEMGAVAAKLTQSRQRAGKQLAVAVRERLGELAMPEAQFEVSVGERPDGCGPRGQDVVEFSISANPGVAVAPLKDVASGGELSRVMLALLSVAHGSPQTSPDADGPLLVFDEIDAGIGGHTARAVGEHLRQLAQGRQILCITHLPQVAALAQRHFTIAKDTQTVPATTAVQALSGEAIVSELVRMLGSGEGDRAANQHARQLLKLAA
ncbi:MAG TPA: DNA repair protein RecN [Solirubrobacteraceae bacterium]|nr:DNA repair protein RecN [Solirubrobacteraceae bacterium]